MNTVLFLHTTETDACYLEPYSKEYGFEIRVVESIGTLDSTIDYSRYALVVFIDPKASSNSMDLRILTTNPDPKTPPIWVACDPTDREKIISYFQQGVEEIIHYPFIKEEFLSKLSQLQSREIEKARSNQLEEALNLAKIAYWNADIETTKMHFNHAFFELVGKPDTRDSYEMDVYEWMDQYIHPDDRGMLEDEIETVRKDLNATEFRNIQFRFRYVSGDYGQMFTRYRFYLGTDGKLKAFGILQDVTSRKVIEDALYQNRRQLEMSQLAIATAHIAVYKVNHDGIIGYVNEYACQMTGYTEEELLSMHITELDGVLNYEEWLGVRNHVHDNHFSLFETKHVRKDGKALTVEISAHYLEFEGEMFAYCFVRDLTELQEQRQKVLELDKKFRKVLANPQSLGVIGINQDCKVVFWNKTSEQMFGYTNREAIGKIVFELICPEPIRAITEPELRRTFATGEPTCAREMTLRKKNGDPITVFASKSLVYEDNEPVLFWVEIDLSDLKKAEAEKEKVFQELLIAKEEAERANKSKNDFIAIMSHEMRTPLNPIIGLSDMLRHESEGELQQLLDIIHDSGTRLNSLINDVMEYVCLGEGTFSPKPIEFDLLDVCMASLSDIQSYREHLDIRLENNHPKCTPVPHNTLVKTDPNILLRIIDNLIVNACKYTTKGSVILKIGLQKEPFKEEAVFHASVCDTGIGLNAESLKVIAESFNQPNESLFRNIEDAGLGLSICKRLLDLLKGSIEVKSLPGEGTTIHFELPVLVEETAEHEDHPAFQWVRFTTAPSILIVDDTPNNGKITSVMLTKMGCRVSLVYNGKEAVDTCEEKTYDLILMDLNMPIMGGYEATQLIRSSKGPNVDIPIVGMSPHITPSFLNNSGNAGFSDYLEKPITPAKLCEILQRYFPW